MLIRPATEHDLPAVAAIYAHEVRTGVATFDLEPRPLVDWQDQFSGAGAGDHLLVVEDGGQVTGYASSSSFRPKQGYRYTRETTIYLAPAARARGVGRRMYDALLGRLVDDGMHLALAAVALPNPASIALHRACGFEEVGRMREVGRKMDRWVDVLWLQKVL